MAVLQRFSNIIKNSLKLILMIDWIFFGDNRAVLQCGATGTKLFIQLLKINVKVLWSWKISWLLLCNDTLT